VRRFQFDSRPPQVHDSAKSLDAQIHAEADIQYEMMGRKITERQESD
jgi:hypothetical protein